MLPDEVLLPYDRLIGSHTDDEEGWGRARSPGRKRIVARTADGYHRVFGSTRPPYPQVHVVEECSMQASVESTFAFGTIS